MKMLKQIILEFWFPLTFAVLWTILRVLSAPDASTGWQQTVLNCIGTFAPAFFFLSFLSGQWFRVRKQLKVEGGLISVEQRITDLVGHMEMQASHLEKQAKDIVGYTTGGESYCRVMCAFDGTKSDSLVLIAIHCGEYPLTNIDIRVCDLDLLREGTALVNDRFFTIDRLLPDTNSMFGSFPMNGRDSRNFNIFMYAQNGRTVQEVRMVKDEAGWHHAQRVTRDYDTLYEELPEGSPLGTNPWG